MLRTAINQPDFCIKTERLMLVPLSEAHLKPFFLEFTEEITRYQFPEPFPSIEEARAFFLRAQSFREEGEELVCAVIANDGAFLGSAEARNITSPTPEVGIWLKAGAHGKGYAKEAMTAFLAFFRAQHKVDFFVYEADRRNPASIKLALSLGGELQCDYEAQSAGGELLRLKLFYID